MNFSNIARQLNEGVSLDAAASAAEKATAGGQKQKEGTMNAREKQKSQMAAQQNTPVKSDVSYASEEARKEREYAKMLNNQAVDWRKELIEAAKPDAEGNHPYVDVMPSMDQKQQEAKRQMKDAAKMKAGQQQQSNAMQPSGMAEGYEEDETIRPDAHKKGDRFFGMPKKGAMGAKKRRRKARKDRGEEQLPLAGYGKADMRSEGLSVEDQMKVSRDYFKKRASRSPEEKATQEKSDAQSRAKTYAMHKKPDPYKARAGESD